MGRALVLLLLAGCAVPVPPSGGPRDERPPEVVSVDPPDGSVSTSPDRVRIEFDEFINGRTAAAALSITPTPDRPPEIRPGGKRVDVIFRSPLRDSTTYIVTLDTGLQDAHGVALSAPISVAFATGDRINRGRLSGRVTRAEDGEPDAGLDIFAFRRPGGDAPLSLPDSPDYRTQTDDAGGFAFSYLQEGQYFVLGVADANRNQGPDRGERLAWPYTPLTTADSTAGASEVWFSAIVDTTGPQARRAAPLSVRRLEVFFDSDVRLVNRDPARWAVRDSAGVTFPVREVYQPFDDPRRVALFTETLFGNTLVVNSDSVIADSTGNLSAVADLPLGTTARPDTLLPRFEGFRLDTLATEAGISILKPGSRAFMRFQAPVDSAALSAAVSVTDTAGVARPWLAATDNGTEIGVVTGYDGPYHIAVSMAALAGPDSTAIVTVQAASPDHLGELSGVVADGEGPVVILAFPSAGGDVRTTGADSTGAFILNRLPGGATYRLMLFEDINLNGRWDFGSLDPFTPPERRGWLAETPAVRARWDTVLPDTLRLIDFQPTPADTTAASR